VPPPVTGNGLTGRYFPNRTLTGNPALTRNEVVNFDWGTAGPGTGIAKDNFSVRWTGEFKTSTAGAYRFRTITDDGVRLWVNGVQVINNWTDHSATTNTSNAITLAANTRYTIKMEYYEKGGSAVAKLQWRLPNTTPYVSIPREVQFGN
jgi:hypothetical protein